MGRRGATRIVIGLAAAAALLVATPSASAIDLYVDDGGSNAINNCETAANPCATINYAAGIANANASPTDSVRVGGGSYTQAVTLPAGVSLLKDSFGAGTTGAATIDGGASPAVTVQPGAPMRQLAGDFIFKGDSDANEGSVLVAGGANAGFVTISGATFNDTATDKQLSILDGSPRILSNTFSATVNTVSRRAISYEGDGSPEIGGNSIAAAGAATSAYFEAIYVQGVGGSATPNIHDNAISSIGADIVDMNGAGIHLRTASATITGNTIRRATAAFTPAAIRIGDNLTATGTPLTLSRNQVYDFLVAVLVSTKDPVTLSSDVIADNITALSLNASAGVTATGITTRNNGGAPAEIALVDTSLTLDSSFLGSAGPVVQLIGTSTCTSSFSFSTEAPGNCGLAPVANPMFANQAMDDYHLLPGSPLIEAGNPNAPAAGVLDVDGAPRALDGDGDCAARRDVGAYELAAGPFAQCLPQPVAAPPASATPVVPAAKKCKKGRKLRKGKCVRKKKKKK